MPSNKAKQRWNAAHYAQVKVSVSPDIAAAFKVACVENGESQAYVLSGFMADYSLLDHEKAVPKDTLESRKKRRTAVKAIAARLEDVLAAEERFYDNVPDNLRGSKWHEASESSISAMQEIIEMLDDVYA